MKITHWIEHSEEIEINLTSRDISILFKEDDPNTDLNEKTHIALINFNAIASFLIGIPNEIIDNMTKEHRRIISRHLKEQSMRFEDLK